MIVKGKRFTDSFKLKNCVGGVESIESIHDWAKDVIDVLQESRPELTYDCVIKMKPNPRNMKGMDEVSIEFWQTRQFEDRVPDQGYFTTIPTAPRRTERNITVYTSHRQTKLIDCVNEINTKMDELLDRTNEPDIIEMGGKKYKLVEVK